MLWFTAFLITCLLTGLGAALFWLAGAGAPPLSDALRAVLPGPFAPRGLEIWVILGSITGCYAIVRTLVQLTLAYTGSALESSPRGGRSQARRPGQRREQFGGAAARWFASPTGGWLSTYTLLLGCVALVSFPLVWSGVVHPAIWGLTALYSLTVARTAIWPDPVSPLVAAPQGDGTEPANRSAPWGTLEPLEPEIDLPTSLPTAGNQRAAAEYGQHPNPLPGQPEADYLYVSAPAAATDGAPPMDKPIPAAPDPLTPPATQPPVRQQFTADATATGSAAQVASAAREATGSGIRVAPASGDRKTPVGRGWRFWKKSAPVVMAGSPPVALPIAPIASDRFPPPTPATTDETKPVISPGTDDSDPIAADNQPSDSGERFTARNPGSESTV